MDRDSPIVIPDYVLSYTETLEGLGFNTRAIFAGVRIDFRHYKSQPRPLSINEVLRLLSTCYELFGMPYLGLAMGKKIRLTMHGMAGVSAMAQPTYAECLQAASRLSEKAFPPFSMEYFETDTTVGLRIVECLSLAPLSHFFIESLLVNFYNILHFLLGDECEPEYVAFTHSDRGYLKIYQRYFDCRLRFNAPCNEFVVSRQLAQRSLLLANKEIARIAEQDFLKSLPPINLNHLPQKLRLLLIRSMGAFPSLETAARRLGMSSRTLRRQLSSIGTSYHAELDLLRREFAINYLTGSDKCITEIALMLGFCDSSAFSKTFKKWTGESPSDFKRKHAPTDHPDANGEPDFRETATKDTGKIFANSFR
jgi:AraC-like DNA-binding protein